MSFCSQKIKNLPQSQVQRGAICRLASALSVNMGKGCEGGGGSPDPQCAPDAVPMRKKASLCSGQWCHCVGSHGWGKPLHSSLLALHAGALPESKGKGLPSSCCRKTLLLRSCLLVRSQIAPWGLIGNPNCLEHSLCSICLARLLQGWQLLQAPWQSTDTGTYL